MRNNLYYKASIPAVETFGEREVCTKTAAGKREYTFRRSEMWLRQDGNCAICGEFMYGNEYAFDHQDGRGHGGGFRNDAILDAEGNWLNAALCHSCNGKKGSKRYQWLNGKYVQREALREVA